MENPRGEEFRERVHLQLIERLVMMLWLVEPSSSRASPIAANRDRLLAWLDSAGAETAQIVGEYTKDPALAALYAGEVEDVTTEMKGRLERLAAALLKP
jgi:hypothetical protein